MQIFNEVYSLDVIKIMLLQGMFNENTIAKCGVTAISRIASLITFLLFEPYLLLASSYLILI